MQSWGKEKAAIMAKAYQYGGGLTTMQRERIAILEKSLQDMGRTVDVMRATLDLLGLPVFLSQPAESQPAPIVYSLTE
jgi:hypothetical protein